MIWIWRTTIGHVVAQWLCCVQKPKWLEESQWANGRFPTRRKLKSQATSEHNFHWRHPYQGQCQQEEVSEGTGCESGKGLFRTAAQRGQQGKCGANEKGQKGYTAHIWQEYLDLVEQIRKTERTKEIYAQRKETVERVFADAKEKHAMRYTHHFLRKTHALASWKHGFFDKLTTKLQNKIL